MEGLIRVAFPIVYFVGGILQVAAIYAGIIEWWDWNGFFAFFGALFLGYFPVLGFLMGMFGAIDAWGWNPIAATLLFCWPTVLLATVFIGNKASQK